ncbi:hypothetical protein E2F49_05840 [Luteimonas terrae]|uniref:Uncharacterized protein n=2 Tax=Luteimonas terrae TaxID=1530191 RepID=A0A4R5UE02_9GAMM|nr:hypothetical protein E2F49_05840 [Luteimonas terrae]
MARKPDPTPLETSDMTQKTPPEKSPATTSRGNRATGDRMASNGDEYADDNNTSGEGNDASLTAGPGFVRKVDTDKAAGRAGERDSGAGNRAPEADANDDGDGASTQRD